MIGRLLCRVGAHHWGFREEHRWYGTVTLARCLRGCARYRDELIVNIERRREWA